METISIEKQVKNHLDEIESKFEKEQQKNNQVKNDDRKDCKIKDKQDSEQKYKHLLSTYEPSFKRSYSHNQTKNNYEPKQEINKDLEQKSWTQVLSDYSQNYYKCILEKQNEISFKLRLRKCFNS